VSLKQASKSLSIFWRAGVKRVGTIGITNAILLMLSPDYCKWLAIKQMFFSGVSVNFQTNER
jgi:hypothetical protein